VHPEKTAFKKNSTVRNREFCSLFLTVEFFFITVFFLGALLYANSRSLPPPYSFYGGITGSCSIDIPYYLYRYPGSRFCPKIDNFVYSILCRFSFSKCFEYLNYFLLAHSVKATVKLDVNNRLVELNLAGSPQDTLLYHCEMCDLGSLYLGTYNIFVCATLFRGRALFPGIRLHTQK
jgi:hypothetical protein